MSRSASPHPTDAELELLQILWKKGSAGLGQVYDAIQQTRPVAKTTVATTLNVMLKKRLVRRSQTPRGYAWSARIDRHAAAQGIIRKLVGRVFEGSASRLVAHLVEAGELTESERQEIRNLLGPSSLTNRKR
jgi:predicted transcriptional regulator